MRRRSQNSQSLLKRILSSKATISKATVARGGVFAAGAALLFAAGCEQSIAADKPSETSEAIAAFESTLRAETLVALCLVHDDGTFEDILVPESEVAFYLSQGALLGTCSSFFCGGS